MRLHFAETYSSAKVVGERIFDINIEEARAFDNVDIFALAGAEDKAFVLEKPTAVADGQINISFMKQLQNPKINAIEVIPTP